MTELAPYLQPISADQPCGPNLEYDPEYAVLQARLQPKAEVQYGQFAAKPEGPDWSEIERDCRRLLLKSKDLGLHIWLTRARTRVAGAAGLAEGLGALQAVLQTWPEQVHPQLTIDGIFDPAVRANTLAALCDPEGLLEDVREIVVSSSTAFRLTMRDIERAHATPRPPYSPLPEVVQRQLAALHAKGDATVHTLLATARGLQQLAQWISTDPQSRLGDDAPSLQPLLKLFAALSAFQQQTATSTPTPKLQAEALDAPKSALTATTSRAGIHETPGTTAPLPPGPAAMEEGASALGSIQQHQNSREHQREQIRTMLIQVRQWIEHNEPSSPVAVLLKQAQRMWGKRFSEVATLIPPELLQAWDSEDL